MKPRINLNSLLALLAMVVAGYTLYVSLDWPLRTALFPRVIGIPFLCLAITELFLNAFGTKTQREGHAVDFEFSTDVDPAVARRRTLAMFAWTLGFFALILLVGFPLGVPLFVFLYLKAAGKEGWLLTILLTLLSWLFMEGLFDRLLHIPFAEGWLLSLFH